jgi:hypothetical protein
MLRRSIAASAAAVAVAFVAVGSIAAAEPAEDAPAMQLPPGWTEADVQAYAAASTPGEMHARLARAVGTWRGKTSMWMSSDAEPLVGECTVTVTSVMDGRFTRHEIVGETPGMGPYTALAFYGYDNAAGQLVSTSIDNQGTGIMNGAGEMSADGKTFAWRYDYHCPINDKPTSMRDVETIVDPDTRVVDVFGVNPKTGEEFRMMKIELTRVQ